MIPHFWFLAGGSGSQTSFLLDSDLTPEEQEEKARLIAQVLELQNTLDDLSSRVDNVKEENLRLRSENQVLGQYIENLMAASSVFQPANEQPNKSSRRKWTMENSFWKLMLISILAAFWPPFCSFVILTKIGVHLLIWSIFGNVHRFSVMQSIFFHSVDFRYFSTFVNFGQYCWNRRFQCLTIKCLWARKTMTRTTVRTSWKSCQKSLVSRTKMHKMAK